MPTEVPAVAEPEVLAAPEPEVAPPPPPANDDEVLVTGSRIKRSPELAKSAPVEVLDRKTLERSGASNAADIIQTLTAAQGSGFQGGGNILNQGGGSLGTSSVNLRGLGAAATLVLVNGRRLVPSGGGSDQNFADISIIPLSAIERIEVLKGGGSAIYGADAVGGVINIITRSTFDGVRAEVDGQSTTRFDQRDITVSGTVGAKSEHARVMLALSYMNRSELLSDRRPFSRKANVDNVNGNPGTLVIPGYDPSNPSRFRFVDPACSSVPGSAVMQTPTGENCTFNFSKFYPLLPSLERANAFASGSYDLSSHTSVFAEFQANRARSEATASPAYPIPPPLLVVPANHVDNPFGRDVPFIGRALPASAGGKHTGVGDDTFRAVLGLRGDLAGVGAGTLFESWEWELAASWGVSRYVSMVADVLREPLQKAVNSCSDPGNLSGCFNPFYSAYNGTGTPNSQQVIDSFSSVAENISEHTLQTYTGGMSGTLFPLPGGDVGVAFGAEVRHERRASQEDHDANLQRFAFLLGSTDARAARDVLSAYLELRWPFYRGVELQTAARVEHYTDIDKTTPSPFAGLTLNLGQIVGVDRTPKFLRRLQLTGQVTSAFRSPSLYQAYPGFAVVPTLLTVPGSSTQVYLPVQSFGNPNLRPEKALIFSAGLNWQMFDELNLMAEFWNYDYKSRIAVESAAQALGNDATLMGMGLPGDPRVVRDMGGSISRVQVTQRNIPGHVVTNGIDLGGMITLTGATFGGGANDWGALSFGAQGTLTLSYRIPRDTASGLLVPGSSPPLTLDPPHCNAKSCETVGSRNYNTFAPPLPRMRMNFPISYGFKGHGVTVIAHYLSGVENDNDVHADHSLGRLPAIMTFDLQYSYTIKDWVGKELAVRVGAYNLFDTFPPASNDTNGFDTLLYDPRGRMVYAKLVSTF